MQWVIEHWTEIIAAAGMVVGTASAIAALTPTPKDDAFVKKLYGIIDILAINVGKAKDK